MRLRAACERLAAAALALAIVIVTAVALSRTLFAFTPTWTEPVVGLLVFFAVCAAIPAGLQEGVHVSMHMLDRIGGEAGRWRDIAAKALGIAIGLAVAVSAALYANDMFSIGLTDYAGIPEGLPAVVGILFGLILAIVSAADLAALIRRSGDGR